MNTKYKVQLTKDELNKFNFLQESYKVFESTKLKMMSVYQYMIKHSADSVDGLIKSFSDFWKMYKRHHKEIKSKSSFISIICSSVASVLDSFRLFFTVSEKRNEFWSTYAIFFRRAVKL